MTTIMPTNKGSSKQKDEGEGMTKLLEVAIQRARRGKRFSMIRNSNGASFVCDFLWVFNRGHFKIRFVDEGKLHTVSRTF